MAAANWHAYRSLSRDRSITQQRLNKGIVRRIAAYARPYRWSLALFLVCTCVSAVITVAVPLLLKTIIDKGILAHDTAVVLEVAGLVAALGSGVAYVVVCAVYAASLALTLNVGLRRLRVVGEAHVSPMRALRQGFAYVWSTPDMRALMLLAFLMNFAAYPLVGSLLAYVAKDIYGLDQTGLGWLIACFAGGALVGSIAISIHGARIRPALLHGGNDVETVAVAEPHVDDGKGGRGFLNLQ